jgi:4-hydroxybenzoate polyprenyltransferase
MTTARGGIVDRLQDESPREPTARAAALLPLVIELDGSLLRAGIAFEIHAGAAAKLLASPRDTLMALFKGWRSPGKALSSLSEIDYATLPYDLSIVSLALRARAQGRKVYISTAGDPTHAVRIAAHFGLDGVLVLAERDGNTIAADQNGRAVGSWPQDFEYVDDASGVPPTNPTDSKAAYRKWLSALRVHQYAKNTLVFVPLLTSHHLDVASLMSASLAFLAFCTCASSAYLLNDLADLQADRRHPTKRHRAIASGDLSMLSALLAIPALIAMSLLLASAISPAFLATIMGYLAVTIAYSLFLKRMMLVDIVVLAGLYTTRILGGAIAISVHLSEWLFIFSLFVFSSLALIKRYGELTMRHDQDLSDPAGRDYKISDMTIVGALAAASGMNAITIFSLFVASPAVASAYSRPWMLWLLNPLLLYWIGRALMMAHRRQMQDDPIVYTFKDGPSRTTVLAMMCIVLAAI